MATRTGNQGNNRANHRTGTLRPVQATGKRRFVRKTAGLERDYFDYNLLAVVIMLTCFGLVMLYSTSAYEAMVETGGDDMSYFRRQAEYSVGFLVLGLLASQFFDYHFFTEWSGAIYWASIALLVITKFAGRESHGATRWLYIGGISFQTAELAKLAVILYLSALIVHYGPEVKSWKATRTLLLYGFIAAFCTYYFTDNLSTAIIIFGITIALIFITHPKTAPFLAVGAVAVVLIAILVYILINSANSGSFRIRRIQVWLDPESHASEGGYQVMQALYAIGSGGFFGKGLGHSAQKLGALPEAQNDMIFSIICEELGVFGAVLVILMFVFMLYRLFFIAQNAPDLQGSLIASGIFVHIALQVVLNIAVVTNLIPTTGITLPFVSYGGSSIMFLMAEMSFALMVSRQIKFKSS